MTNTITGRGALASAGASDHIPASQTPYGALQQGYLTVDQIVNYALGKANIWTVNGALSAPAATYNGTWITGGSATTCKPYFLIEPTGATSTNWGTSGTAFGINAASGFAAAGDLIMAQVNGVTKFEVLGSGNVVVGNALYDSGTNFGCNFNVTGEVFAKVRFALGASIGSPDVFLTRSAAATLQHGLADAASPAAQLITVQSVVAGTADTAGVNWTMSGSKSTGTGVPGDIIFKTAGKGAASTTQNTLITALTIKGGTTNNTNVGYPSVVVGSGAALGTTATDGFLYIPTCAGTPTGVPTAVTGAIPMVYDTTNHQFWFYDSGWKQPKTPAGAAIVTWQ